MSAKKKLFGNNIHPACAYCHHAKPAADGVMYVCRRNGPVAAHYSCARFAYNPLQRVPKRLPPLPSYSPEDFEL